VTEAEGLYPAGTFVNSDDELKHLDKDFEKLAPFLLDFNLTVSADEMSNVLSLIRTEYFDDRTIDRSQVKSIIKVYIVKNTLNAHVFSKTAHFIFRWCRTECSSSMLNGQPSCKRLLQMRQYGFISLASEDNIA